MVTPHVTPTPTAAQPSELEYVKERLERFIDTSSLDSVLELIEGICSGKAEHLAANWQDERAAKSWERAARVIARAANHRHVLAVQA